MFVQTEERGGPTRATGCPISSSTLLRLLDLSAPLHNHSGCCHFIAKNAHQESRLLAVRQYQGVPSGQHLAGTISAVVSDWKINAGRSAIVSDDTPKNDTCLHRFFNGLRLDMKRGDIKIRRMRCLGQILNQLARALLFGAGADRFETQLQGFCSLNQSEAYIQHWRKRGPIGKLHNVVGYIRSSPKRAETFRNMAKEAEEGYQLAAAEMELFPENKTGWVSTYLMIEQAIRKNVELHGFLFFDQTGKY